MSEVTQEVTQEVAEDKSEDIIPENVKKISYLTEDDEISGQKFYCISFLTADQLENKENASSVGPKQSTSPKKKQNTSAEFSPQKQQVKVIQARLDPKLG